MFGFTRKKLEIPSPEEALPGRDTPIPTSKNHYVNGNPLKGPYPAGHKIAYLAFGCYWGCERVFWTLPGVWVTAVGNIGGTTPNPTYQEVCSGRTGHAEAVKVVFDPTVISYEQILKHFWEAHDPTQGMRQGNDVGTQYRSGIYWVGDAQRDTAIASKQGYQKALDARGYGSITAEVREAGEFYYAEQEHQQYLGKNPMGYCGLAGTGVSCPIGVGVEA